MYSLNVCRHRGAQLVSDDRGCKRRFSCPYHAWTYNGRGELVAAPHQETGFPDLDKSKYGLKELPSDERYGWVWTRLDGDGPLNVEGALQGFEADFEWLNTENIRVAHRVEDVREANWKVLVEGGIEAYHFRVAHRKTIGPHFNDNLSSYEMFGSNMRSILPRRTIEDLPGKPKSEWRLRDHANIIYSIFPGNQLLVAQDHVSWFRTEPLSPGRTRFSSMIFSESDGPISEDESRHLEFNLNLNMEVLDEDFVLAEGIQRGFAMGANETVTFGRYEGALDRFNKLIEAHLSAPAAS